MKFEIIIYNINIEQSTINNTTSTKLISVLSSMYKQMIQKRYSSWSKEAAADSKVVSTV